MLGAGSGIGRAVCQVFAREGAALAVVDLNKDSANQTVDSLPKGIHDQLVMFFSKSTFEPQQDKTNKMSVRPAKTQIS